MEIVNEIVVNKVWIMRIKYCWLESRNGNEKMKNGRLEDMEWGFVFRSFMERKCWSLI